MTWALSDVCLYCFMYRGIEADDHEHWDRRTIEVDNQTWRGRTAKYAKRGSTGDGGGGGIVGSPIKGGPKDRRRRGDTAPGAQEEVGPIEGEEGEVSTRSALKKLQTSKRRLEKTVGVWANTNSRRSTCMAHA